MRLKFKITSGLLAAIRADLRRQHAFAHERIGFISAGLSGSGGDILAIARDYRPVEDRDYLMNPSVGAMMGPEAIRKALDWAMAAGHGLFHVHTHGGRGVPGFSSVDIRENAKFVPDFFKVAPHCVHGAIVLSSDAARGQAWLGRRTKPVPIDDFVEVGPSLRKWGPA